MPKAKTTKRTASGSSKTTAKKGLFGKSFSLKSRKVQFFVVILIVAILGGGWYTYKSFAAGTTISATMSNYKLKGSPAVGYFDPGKNNIQVLKVSSAGGYAEAKLSVPKYTNINYCYIARADKPIGAFLGGWIGPMGGGGLPSANTIIGTSYGAHCMTRYSGNYTSIEIQLYSSVQGQANPHASMYVSQLYVQF